MKVSLEKRIDVNYVLKFIKGNKFANPDSSPIFRRRFVMILNHWVKILPKPVFFSLLNDVLQSLNTLGTPQVPANAAAAASAGIPAISLSSLEQVLAFEHSHCVHQMLKEIHHWLDKA